MEELNSNFLRDFDPYENYYNQDITHNQIFAGYTTIDEFLSENSNSIRDENFITIFSQNIRSFNKNLDSFLCLFPENGMPDVFIFCETWHCINTPVVIPGYTGYHPTRTSKRSGGVSVF